MKRWGPWVVLAVLGVGALAWAARPEPGTNSAGARVQRITSQLRCEECVGLSVADSSAPTSEAIRSDVRRRVDAGESDAEIRRAYVDRYGEDILMSPPASGISLFVWLVPLSAFVLAVLGLAFAFRRWRRGPWRRASAEDEQIVDRLRGAP